MSNNEICIHEGVAPASLLEELHRNQGGSGRHRCPTCAYERGFSIGSSGQWNTYQDYVGSIVDAEACPEGSVAPSHELEQLGDNQGGTGRHKCTNCAFRQGFEVGLLENGEENIELELVESPRDLELINPELQTSEQERSKIDHIEKELKNKRLGDLGELFIIKNEVLFLKENGRDDLAQKVVHVAKELGDFEGYDILSYDLDGKKKLIEVKTTRSNKDRPFFITEHEVSVSEKNESNYYLYRLFDFDTELNKGKYYSIQGNLRSLLQLRAKLYIALPK